ncbi:MAG: flagellar protein export ATPase FliI [Bacillota bacterium]
MFKIVGETDTMPLTGKVTQVVGLTVESLGPAATVGEVCRLQSPETGKRVLLQVVGFRGERVLLMALGEMDGIGPGSEVVSTGRQLEVGVGDGLLGRVVNGLGNPVDGLGPVRVSARYPILNSPPGPLSRRRITEKLAVGVRSIDALLTCGRGQRMGIFSGSGVGKSTLLGMIARHTEADVNVIALVGERGREVREFIERDLGTEGLARSVVVVATSDQPALLRINAAHTAVAIAEYFRDRGKDVLLLLDSLTRFAMGLREVGLAIGEPPTSRGYTPSVFAALPRLLERTGNTESGSITGFFTVLVDGDDLNEPVSDAVRGILDGHIVLSRALASAGLYPAVDVLASLSRVMNDLVPPEHRSAASTFRRLLAVYRESEDLINVGAYQKGSNPRIDQALAKIDQMNAFLAQDTGEHADFEDSRNRLLQLF